MEKLDMVYKYTPIIRFDSREPFSPIRIGYTVFSKSDKSLSFERVVEVSSGTTAIEYAIYWDWDIGHLYELEHVWVYVMSEKVTKVEASWHGKFNVMNDVTFNFTHPILYSQPGKHAFASNPQRFEPRQEFIIPCIRERAGTMGLLVVKMFKDIIKKISEDDRLVLSYLKQFAFIPSFEFTKEFRIKEDILVSWEELCQWIPKRIKLWMNKLRETAEEKGEKYLAEVVKTTINAKFTNIDKDGEGDHFLVEFTYEGESGSTIINEITFSLNGESIPLNKVRLKIGEVDFQPVRLGMSVSAKFGEKVVLEIAKKEGLSKEKHLLEVTVKISAFIIAQVFVLQGLSPTLG